MKSVRFFVIGVWLAIVPSIGACGGGSSGSSSNCGKVAPCGGNIVGTWKISDACSGAPPSQSSTCANATGQVALNASGTFTFNADMTYSMSLNESSSYVVNLPANCLSMGGVTLTCDQVTMAASSPMQDGGTAASGPPINCVAAGSGCSCTIGFGAFHVAESGTYTLSGTTVSTTTSAGGGSTNSYCAQGNALHLISPTSSVSMGAMGQMTVSSDIVATKQ